MSQNSQQHDGHGVDAQCTLSQIVKSYAVNRLTSGESEYYGIVKCANRQTVSGGSFTLGGGSTYNTRNTSLHKCASCTSVILSFNGRLFRDTLLVMASEITNLIVSRGGVDAKKFALSSSVFLRFFTSFATNRHRTSGDRSSLLLVSTHLAYGLRDCWSVHGARRPGCCSPPEAGGV